MFWLNWVSVSDSPGRYAAAAAGKQETGAVEKVTDCGFVSAIKSGAHLLPLCPGRPRWIVGRVWSSRVN